MIKFKAGDVVKFVPRIPEPDCLESYNIVVLHVTKAQIMRGSVDAPKPGFYGFYGMWYGDDPMRIESFGKIEYLGPRHVKIGTVDHYTLKELRGF